MADYDALDDATLQQMLSEASSYEERSKLRQVLRKRKKIDKVTVASTKPRGNSMYNRFAGSTAPKSSSSTHKILVPANVDAKEDTKSSPTHAYKKSPTQQPSLSIQQPSSPIQQSSSPIQQPSSPIQQPSSPIQQPSSPIQQPSSPIQEPQPVSVEKDSLEEIDRPPVASEPDEDEEANQADVDNSHDQSHEGGYNVGDAIDSSTSLSPSSESKPKKEFTDGFSGSEVGSVKELQHYLVTYVNQELSLDPPLPVKGKALFDTCSDPVALCKLINKAVSGTIDMRALSKMSGSAPQRFEAMQDNMTLVVESACAIGCQIHDTMQDKIIEKEPETIKSFLVDIIRARVAHMPGMEDEPSSTFTDLDALFQKLNISVNQGHDESKRDNNPNEDKSKGDLKQSEDSTKLTYEERAARRKAEREQRLKQEKDGGSSVELTYEERAAQRKAERENRRREREALAK